MEIQRLLDLDIEEMHKMIIARMENTTGETYPFYSPIISEDAPSEDDNYMPLCDSEGPVLFATPSNEVDQTCPSMTDSLRQLTRTVAKRYGDMFRVGVEDNNPSYSVHLTRKNVFLRVHIDGLIENVKTFEYKAGVVKGLYCILKLCDYNVVEFIAHINRYGFQPLSEKL